MEPTFDDFIALAEERLDLAALAISDGEAVSSATCAALSAATRALARLSTRYGPMPHGAPVTAWQPAFTDRLAAADRRLRRHADPANAPSAADDLIADAASLITVAQDLLATHLTVPDPPRQFARTPTGADLLDAPAREHVLHRAAELTSHLAHVANTAAIFDDLTLHRPHLADAYRPRDRDLANAARDLSAAAALRSDAALEHLQIATAPVMAAPVTYPAPNELPDQAAGEIRSALDRLATAAYQAAHPLDTGEHPPTHTADNLAETAAALALAHVLAADLLTRLAPNLPAPAAWNPLQAAEQLRAAGATWAQIRRSWAQTASVPDSGPRSPLTIQAGIVPLRLGRLLYTDPTWNPQHGPGQPRPLTDLLTPQTLEALCPAISTLPRAAATLAANHRLLITDHRIDLYSTDRTHRPEGEARRFYPLQPNQRTDLTTRYQAAAQASKSAATGLTPLSRGYHALRIAAAMQTAGPTASPHYAQTQRPRPTQPHRTAGSPTVRKP